MKKNIFIALGVALCCCTPIFANEYDSSVTVQGTGNVTVSPDLGTISFAVEEEGEKAGDVQNNVSKRANEIKDTLIKEGLSEDNFSTSGIRLYTLYDYEHDDRITGYNGQISMTIEEIDISDVGKYLGILATTGVDRIDGIEVFYSGYDDAYSEALEEAMEKAHQKAEKIASSENTKLTGNFTAEEGYQNMSLRSMTKNFDTAYVAEDVEESVNLDYSAGTTEVKATVTVCYETEK